ncbi:MAG: hypothetical protein JO056_09505 [Alphaproteobacteria bacterium]|nr:hypothetical protein [Alphaproteobacteria bacterium]
MHAFRVIYRQGSFSLADDYSSWEQALARAVSLLADPGVWHVHVEDPLGRRVVTRLDLEECRRDASPCMAS